MRYAVALNLAFWVSLALAVEPAGDSRPATTPAGDFLFKKGDRIVFLGDSITEQHQYSSYIELYLTTRFPAGEMMFFNAGIGGHAASSGLGRFRKHVLDEKPTVVTINFGMCDVFYGESSGAGNRAVYQKSYAKNIEAMLELARQGGVRVALLSPNATDPRCHPEKGKYLEPQKELYAPLKDLAAKHQAAFVDQYAVTRAMLEKLETQSAEAKSLRSFPDGAHTGPSGGLLMAHTILTGLNAPALVSQVDIDASTGKVTAQGASVGKLTTTPADVAFDRKDEALPLPVLKEWVALLPHLNDLKDVNWYGLKVSGLAAGRYALKIDDQQVATFTAKQLAEGVNLGSLSSGPLWDQGQKVLAAINAKNQLVRKRFTSGDVGNPDKGMEQINAQQAQIYQLVQPLTHRFVLTRTK